MEFHLTVLAIRIQIFLLVSAPYCLLFSAVNFNILQYSLYFSVGCKNGVKVCLKVIGLTNQEAEKCVKHRKERRLEFFQVLVQFWYLRFS